jgi:uncharacterized membrane protein YqjE
VDTKPARTVAHLLLGGLALSVLGMMLIGVTVDHGSRLGATVAAIASVAGFALVLTALVKWALRSRRATSPPVDHTPSPAAV